MSYQIQIRRDTESNWTSINPILANGEFGYETDTGKMKIGDGSTAWTSLDYFSSGGGGGGDVSSVNGETGDVVLDQDDIGDGSTYVQTHNDFTDTLKGILETEGVNIYFVGKHGNDSNDGKRWDEAKLTFQNAINTASSGDAVVCLDSAVYSEDLTCVDGVEVFAPNATLDLGTDNQLDLAGQKTTFKKITRTSGGDSAILNNSAGDTSILYVEDIEDSGSGITIRSTTTSILIAHINRIFVNGGGIAIADFSSGSQHVHLEIDDIYLNSDNSTAIQVNNSGSNIVGSVQHIVETGTRTGTLAFDVNDGQLNINVQQITADIAYDIESGATLNLFCNSLSGTETNDGTANVCKADEISTGLTKLDGVESGADVTDADNVASTINGVSSKATPVDADEVGLVDSESSNVLKKLTWSNIKATLKTYFDTLYTALTGTGSDTFDDADLSSGELTITHNLSLSAPYTITVTIFDNNNEQIIPDSVTGAENSVTVDLSSYGTLSGTWAYFYTVV